LGLSLILFKPVFKQKFRQLAGISSTIGNKNSDKITDIFLLKNLGTKLSSKKNFSNSKKLKL